VHNLGSYNPQYFLAHSLPSTIWRLRLNDNAIIISRINVYIISADFRLDEALRRCPSVRCQAVSARTNGLGLLTVVANTGVGLGGTVVLPPSCIAVPEPSRSRYYRQPSCITLMIRFSWLNVNFLSMPPVLEGSSYLLYLLSTSVRKYLCIATTCVSSEIPNKCSLFTESGGSFLHGATCLHSWLKCSAC